MSKVRRQMSEVRAVKAQRSKVKQLEQFNTKVGYQISSVKGQTVGKV